MKKHGMFVILLLAINGCNAHIIARPKIDVYPPVADYTQLCEYHTQSDLPAVEDLLAPNLTKRNTDFRSCDLSNFDLSMYPSNLADYINFDSKTKWPANDKMPAGFYPASYLRQGRNPGLHIHSLHKRGIDGRGVSVAVIDQPLLVTHQEYKHQLKWYESAAPSWHEAQMHGPAVASIMVGKTVGIAPGADLYYVATAWGERMNGVWDVRPAAAALERILEINEQLPKDKKIRVVSLSLGGFDRAQKGAQEWKTQAARAQKQGIAIFTTDDLLFTLSRAQASADADENSSYVRGASWLEEEDLPSYSYMEEILVPTNYRVTAAPNASKDYVAYASGGLSWAVPYVAGLYALGVQVYPQLNKEIFFQVMRQTAVPAQVKGKKGIYQANYLVQPQVFIERLESMNK